MIFPPSIQFLYKSKIVVFLVEATSICRLPEKSPVTKCQEPRHLPCPSALHTVTLHLLPSGTSYHERVSWNKIWKFFGIGIPLKMSPLPLNRLEVKKNSLNFPNAPFAVALLVRLVVFDKPPFWTHFKDVFWSMASLACYIVLPYQSLQNVHIFYPVREPKLIFQHCTKISESHHF